MVGRFVKRGGSSLSKFPAIAHVALTVSDLDRSRKWYQRLFGSDPVLDQDTGPFHQVVWSLSGALLAINGFPDLHSYEPFDERRPGLDHLAFACSSRSELEAWERRLNEWDIPNGGVVDANYGSVLSFRDPDNIALEFFSPPG
jgi:glyoxylase I family protein